MNNRQFSGGKDPAAFENLSKIKLSLEGIHTSTRLLQATKARKLEFMLAALSKENAQNQESFTKQLRDLSKKHFKECDFNRISHKEIVTTLNLNIKTLTGTIAKLRAENYSKIEREGQYNEKISSLQKSLVSNGDGLKDREDLELRVGVMEKFMDGMVKMVEEFDLENQKLRTDFDKTEKINSDYNREIHGIVNLLWHLVNKARLPEAEFVEMAGKVRQATRKDLKTVFKGLKASGGLVEKMCAVR